MITDPFILKSTSSVLSFQPGLFGFCWWQTFRFCLSGNIIISPSSLKDTFIRSRNLHWQIFFSFNTLNISSHCLLASMASDKISAANLISAPLYMVSCFFLVASRLPHGFWLLTVWLWCIYVGSLNLSYLNFMELLEQWQIVFHQLWQGFNLYLFNNSALPLSPCGTPIMCTLAYIMVPHRSVFNFLSCFFCSLDCMVQSILPHICFFFLLHTTFYTSH